MSIDERNARAGIMHDIRGKLSLQAPLTQKERAFYLLFIASQQEAKTFIENEKKYQGGIL